MIPRLSYFIGLIFVCSIQARGQSVPFSGYWKDTLEVGAQKIPLGLEIEQDSTTQVFLDVPSQQAMHLPCQLKYADADSLSLSFTNIKLTLAFESADSSWRGTYRQSVFSTAIHFTKSESAFKRVVRHRPQTPKGPFPYSSTDLLLDLNTQGVRVAGTLTRPSTQAKGLMILSSGSGAQDRNSSLFEHQPFWVLADHFTRAGYAVFRYDDRGVGASTGNFAGASLQDLASDLEDVIVQLQRKAALRDLPIILVGHSQGAAVATLAAKNYPPDALVWLAGVGAPGPEMLALQNKKILEGQIDSVLLERYVNYLDTAFTRVATTDYSLNKLLEYFKNPPFSKEECKALNLSTQTRLNLAMQLNSIPMRSLLAFDAAAHFPTLKMPFLALNGEKDMQVDAAQNLGALREILQRTGHQAYRLKRLDGLNHLFQPAKTGLPKEYMEIETTFSTAAMDEVILFLDRYFDTEK